MTRRGFLWGMVKASAAVAAVATGVATAIKKAPGFKITKVNSDLSRSELNRALMNGTWKWVNIQDVKCGSKIGNFQGMFEIFPRPDQSRLPLFYRELIDDHVNELLQG